MEQKYMELKNYLKLFTETFGLNLCFKDFIDFLKSDKELHRILTPYLVHKNPFCMQVKYGYNLWKSCNATLTKLSRRCDKEKNAFYGYCPMGYGEFVVPVMRKNIAIGALCCGPVCKDIKTAHFLLNKKAEANGFNFSDAAFLLNSVLVKQNYELEKIHDLLGIAAAYIGEVFGSLTQEQIQQKIELKRNKISKQKVVVLKITEHINKNYQENITVKKMAEFCQCSESYINHKFKAIMGCNIRAYLNFVRIEAAKKLLREPQYNVSHIACQVGFNDPDYFTLVFKKICQLTPMEFRNKFAEN